MEWGIDSVGIAVVTLCHDGQGNYLLGKRSEKCSDEHSRWDLLGSGKVEFGETNKEAIYREVKEECGSDVIKIEYLGHRELIGEVEGSLMHRVPFDYLVQIDRDKVFNAEPEKCVEIKWFKLGDFPTSMHSQWPVFLERYKDKL
ncbi:NUDIX hydrolase [Candidatus Kaiserbacteria bacterium]|nr:NUDIX hydrolase [Candidatus Kaiserbacteria bacterium]